MRRMIYIFFVLAAAGAVYFLTPREEKPVPPLTMTGPQSGRELLENTMLTVPEYDVRVTLNKGRAEFEQGPVRGTVELGDVFADWKTGTGIDLSGYVIVSSGGSGTFLYLVIYSITAAGLKHEDSAFLGDRIAVRSIRTESRPDGDGYRVIVTVLDRGADEPMSAPPTVEKELAFPVANHRFIK